MRINSCLKAYCDPVMKESLVFFGPLVPPPTDMTHEK